MSTGTEQKLDKSQDKLEAKKDEARKLIKSLVEAGTHLGHETNKRNPKMKEYIHSVSNGLHIIDLTKTVPALMKAADFLKRQAKLDRNIIIVGTSKHASEVVKQEAERAGVYYINQRWLGGFVTNFETIRTRLNKLRELEHTRDSGGFKGLGKKEIAALNRQIAKLNKSLGGLKKMKGRPEVIFVLDQNEDRLAITETKKANGVTLMAMADTDCDPSGLDYVIPGNDDSLSSVSFILEYLADSILEGKQKSKNTFAA